MSPKGTCDPGPGLSNEQRIQPGDGIFIDVFYGWDHVSIWPNCDGPIESVHLVNQSGQSWWVHVPQGRKSKAIQVTTGTDLMITGPQLATIGLETLADLSGLIWRPTSDPNVGSIPR